MYIIYSIIEKFGVPFLKKKMYLKCIMWHWILE